MKNERNNGMKPLEGVSLFDGVRSDNLSEEDPVKLHDGIVRYPDAEGDEVKQDDGEQKEVKNTVPVKKFDDKEEQYKVGGPLTVDLAGKQMDEYSKEK